MEMLGKYEILEELGKGGYGTVYRAKDTVLEVERAVKVLHPTLTTDPEFILRFKKEAQITAGLEHPNIVPVFDLNEDHGRYFLTMQYMSGKSLKDILDQEDRLSFERAVQINQQIANALDFSHQKDLIHRDIKPGNILFDAIGNAYLADLGFAKALSNASSSSLSATGGIIGTPSYMAPEVWRKGKGLSAASDIYSLACVFYEMIVGTILFDGESPPEVMTSHVLDGPQFPETWPKNIPENIQEVLEKALSQNTADRYQTAGDFAQAINHLTADTDMQVVIVAKPPEKIQDDPADEGSDDLEVDHPIVSVGFESDSSEGSSYTGKKLVEEKEQPEVKKSNRLVLWGLAGIFGIAILILVLFGVFGGDIFRGEEQASVPTIVSHSAAELLPPTDTIAPTPIKNTPDSSSGQLSNEISTATPTKTATPTSTPSPTLTPTQPPIAVVNVRNANIRSGPATNFSILESAPEGTELLAIGRNKENTWLVVELENNKQGWISIDIVDFEFSINMLAEIESPPTPIPPPPTPTTKPTKKPYGGAILLPPSLTNEKPFAVASYSRQIMSLVSFCGALFIILGVQKDQIIRRVRKTWQRSITLFVSVLSLR